MERKVWKNCLGAFLVASIAAGCSSDNFVTDEPGTYPVDPQDAVYMNITMQLPDSRGSRSVTIPGGGSSSGVEIGKDKENKINEVMMVFTKSNYEIIAYGEQESTAEIDNNGRVKSVQKISKSVLSAYYGTDNTLSSEEQTVNVILLANANKAIKDKIEEAYTQKTTTWINEICTINESSSSSVNGASNDNSAIWGGDKHEGGFLMTSSVIVTKKLPRDFSDWEHHTSAVDAFQLSGINHANSDQQIDNTGSIRIERSVARFDFRDGSPKGNNTYDVVTETVNDVTTPVLQIQLQKMSLVNMSKNFFFFRRVSADGLPSGSIIGGLETDKNYVVDTDASSKNDETFVSTLGFKDNFNFGLHHISGSVASIDYNARNQWYTSKISDVLAGEGDNYEGWTGEGKPSTDPGYHVWRYVTENTIPGPVNRQVAGITTGVVFQGKMIAPENSESTLAKAINNATGNSNIDKILYVHGNNIYVSWVEVREAALESGTGSDFYRQVFGVPTNTPSDRVYSNDVKSPDYLWDAWHNKANAQDDAKKKAFKAAAINAGCTIYESSKDDANNPGYYCYYYYWNRHNDNGNSGVMGVMEFAVVRNNVYKLAVTNIRRLGHPRLSENDPDPVTPGTPDEKGDVYFDVEVKAVPWVVRVNDIEF